MIATLMNLVEEEPRRMMIPELVVQRSHGQRVSLRNVVTS